MGAHFRGADGTFEDGGNFGKREFLKTTEQENFAIIPIEPVQGVVQDFMIVTGDGFVPGVRLVVGVMLQIGRIGGRGRPLGFAIVIHGTAPGQVIHPGGEATFVAVGVPVFEDALKHDLSDVFGGRAVVGQFGQKTKQRTMVAFKEFAQGIELTFAHGEYEFVVGLRGRGFHGSVTGRVNRGNAAGNRDI